jgi:hypothetical protein
VDPALAVKLESHHPRVSPVLFPDGAHHAASRRRRLVRSGGGGENFGRSFTGYRLAAQLGALGATAALAGSATDADVHRHFVPGQADAWADPAIYAGFLLPPLVGGTLYLAGGDDDRIRTASYAATQASLLTLGYVTALKFISGRPRPDASEFAIDEQSRTFRPGREGIVYGWPPGHTAVTAAPLSSLAAYTESPALWGLAAAGRLYMGAAMVGAEGSPQHWLSDTVAGGFIGFAVGTSVGEGFRRLRATAEEDAAVWSPIVLEREAAGFGSRSRCWGGSKRSSPGGKSSSPCAEPRTARR